MCRILMIAIFIFWNLVANTQSNLIRDMDADTRVDVESTQDNDQIQFTIKNNPKLIMKETSGLFQLELIDPSQHKNIFLGAGMTPNGYNNLMLGFDVGNQLLSNSFNNISLGNGSGANLSSAQDNTFVGLHAGHGAANVNRNSYFGGLAGANNTYGSGNVFLGFNSGSLSTSNESVLAGIQSGFELKGLSNIAIGSRTGYSSNGIHNILLGTNGGRKNFGSENLLFGYNAGSNNEGDQNVYLGSSAARDSKGNQNIFLGYLAGSQNNSNRNIFMGIQAGKYNSSLKPNLFIGNFSGLNNTSGGNNVFLGHHVGRNNTSGQSNTFVGFEAGELTDKGNDNVMIGRAAGKFNTNGNKNAILGNFSGTDITTGSNNVMLGYFAGRNSESGSGNVFLGYYAEPNKLSSTNCTVIGHYARTGGVGNFTNSTVIGNGAYIYGSNRIIIGNSAVGLIGGYAGWFEFSDRRIKKNVSEEVPGLAFIKKLRPVSYQVDYHKINEEQIANSGKDFQKNYVQDPIELASIKKKSLVRQSGFIAQEVDALVNELSVDFNGVGQPANEQDYYSLKYSEFVVPLVKSVQELETIVSDQKEQLSIQASINKSLQEQINRLEKLMRDGEQGIRME